MTGSPMFRELSVVGFCEMHAADSKAYKDLIQCHHALQANPSSLMLSAAELEASARYRDARKLYLSLFFSEG